MNYAKRLTDEVRDKSRGINTSEDNLFPMAVSLVDMNEIDAQRRRSDRRGRVKFNREIKNWANKTSNKLKSNVGSMVNRNHILADSIYPKLHHTSKVGKEVKMISFVFARHGVYLYHGAGRGQGGLRGSLWKNKQGNLQKTHTDSLRKAGTGNRKEVDWYSSIIKRELPQLADIVAEYSSHIDLNVESVFRK